MFFEIYDHFSLLMSCFFQVPPETCQNVSRMDHQRGWAVTKVTRSRQDQRKPYWMVWNAGHTPWWLVAAVVLMTREDRDDQNHHYIRCWMANQKPLAWTTWQEGRSTLRVHCLMSGQRVYLPFTTLDLWGRPICRTLHPLCSRVSWIPSPHDSRSRAPPTKL